MPQEFVARWAKLETLAASVSSLHESLGERPTPTPDPGSVGPTGFRPKNEGDYEADIRGGKQRRTRGHEKLVRLVGEWFKKEGATMSTPHPVDLLMSHPSVVIFEAKTTHARTVLNAVREAVGQLFEYRRFIGPSEAQLAILLDQAPDPILLRYVEEDLGILLVWWDGKQVTGPKLYRMLG